MQAGGCSYQFQATRCMATRRCDADAQNLLSSLILVNVPYKRLIPNVNDKCGVRRGSKKKTEVKSSVCKAAAYDRVIKGACVGRQATATELMSGFQQIKLECTNVINNFKII